jgi:carbonic anhydrase
VSSADKALRLLKEGNRRFAAGEMIHPDQTVQRRKEVAKGQKPFAIVFGCVDSRVPPEIVFDRGLGDLLVIRTAGHALDSASLNSVEFGVHELGIPLVMVLGHQKCGAVAASIEAVEKGAKPHGHIGALVAAIKPAVEKVKGRPGDLLDNAVRANVELTVNKLQRSKLLAEFLAKGKAKVVGARYDLGTGAVEITVS